MDIDVGRVIAGKYELVRLLGRGSMGEVWVAHHQTLGEHLAIKLLTLAPSAEEELEDARTAAARFQFEAQVAARLSRKTRHIVRVTDHGEEEGRAYLAMELLEGETLEAVLIRERRVPVPTVVKIVSQVARALAQAHGEGVLHRDLKPANVFLTKDEEGKLLAKLLDFGIARAIHAHKAPSAYSTAKGLVFGTPSYMSPEQARASAKLDQRCDLWSLATIAYEALSGELPLDGNDTDEVLQNLCAGRVVPLRRRAPELSPALEAFFGRAFSEAIGLRFQSAGDLSDAFARAAAASVGDRGRSTYPPASERAGALSSGVVSEQAGLRSAARRRVFAVGTILAVVGLVLVGLAWRAFAPSAVTADTESPTRGAGVHPPAPSALVAPIAPALSPDLPPSTVDARATDGPTVAFSALPRAPAPRLAPAAPQAPATNPVPELLPVQPPATAVPAASPPSPPSPTRKIDKSEVL